MTEIKLNVKRQGNQVGTCGWLKKELENAHLEISQMKGDGLPCIVLCTKKDDKEKRELLAFVSVNEEDGMYYEIEGEIAKIYPEQDQDGNNVGFANYLTTAACQIIRDLINDAAGVLKKHLDADKADFEIEITGK